MAARRQKITRRFSGNKGGEMKELAALVVMCWFPIIAGFIAYVIFGAPVWVSVCVCFTSFVLIMMAVLSEYAPRNRKLTDDQVRGMLQ